MIDNRTSEPTEAQVEAAAKALYEFETGLAEDSWGRAYEVERSLWRDEARAALVAAQGAAPSGDIRALAEAEVRKTAAEGNPISQPGVTKDIAFIRGADFGADVAARGAEPQAESEYVYCPIHGDLLAGNRSYRCSNAPTGHEFAAPVLPSSTADEDDCWHEANCRCVRERLVDEDALAAKTAAL